MTRNFRGALLCHGGKDLIATNRLFYQIKRRLDKLFAGSDGLFSD
jgi:hypothetical protein